MNSQERPMSLDRHPVALREYRIPTPTLDAFYSLIVRSLRFKIHGSIIYGRSRFGKSSGIDFLEQFLAKKDKTLPLIKLACQRKKSPSESAFLSNLLSAAAQAGFEPSRTTAGTQMRGGTIFWKAYKIPGFNCLGMSSTSLSRCAQSSSGLSRERLSIVGSS